MISTLYNNHTDKIPFRAVFPLVNVVGSIARQKFDPASVLQVEVRSEESQVKSQKSQVTIHKGDC